MLIRGIADDAHRDRPGHAGQDVARREAQTQDRGVARRRRLDARRRVGRDDGPHPPGIVAVEADEAPVDTIAWHTGGRRPDRHRATKVEPGGVEAFRGSSGDDPGEVVAGTDRMDLGGPGGDHHLVGVDVEHPAWRAGDDRGAGVDGHDLVPVRSLEDEDLLAGHPGRGRSGQTARPATDHGDLDLAALDLDLRSARRPSHVRLLDDGEWRHRATRMPDDLEPGPARSQARPDVCDPVDRREAVRAVAGEAQGPAAARLLAGSQRGERDGIAGLEREGAPVEDDPTRSRRRGIGRSGSDGLGHWRIRVPSGSKLGRGWRRAGRRRPMISTSKPWPPGPSGVARSVGT